MKRGLKERVAEAVEVVGFRYNPCPDEKGTERKKARPETLSKFRLQSLPR